MVPQEFHHPRRSGGQTGAHRFDGVYMDATVYINGQEVGNHPYGYTPFSYDLTDYIKFGEENVIAVKVNHEDSLQPLVFRSGIYRSVDLTITDPVHVGLCGTQVTTPDLGEGNTSRVRTVIAATVDNDSQEEKTVKLVHTLYKKGDGDRTPVASAETEEAVIAPGASHEFETETTVSNPDLWGLDSPELYVVETQVQSADR